MARKKEWECRMCGDKTDNPDQLCVVCRTDTTAVKGFVSKKDLK
jgi:rubrerythrin